MVNQVKRYDDPSAIVLDKSYNIIWLASWYPSRTMPTNGDFIQRHAAALSGFMPLLVIHTIHDPALENKVSYEVHESGSLTEIIIYFRHNGDTSGIWNKMTYNFAFYRYTRECISSIFSRYGKPLALHVHVPMKMGKLALWAKRKWDIPYFVSEQSSKYVGDAPDHFNRRSIIYRNAVRDIFRNARGISNVSARVARIIEQMFQVKDVRVIRNLADTREFSYNGRVAGEPFRFIHVSTLTEQKNFKGILCAFEKLSHERKDFELLVLGGEPGDNAQWPVQDPPWLKWMGTVPHTEVAGFMQSADAFVLFSRDENFPCVIVEALCTGLPVITSDAGGCAEAIVPENGTVISSGDEEALLGALRRMITDYRKYDRAVISAAASGKYSYEAVGGNFMELYRLHGINP